jgi:RND family efflux transporter MFP subunit
MTNEPIPTLSEQTDISSAEAQATRKRMKFWLGGAALIAVGLAAAGIASRWIGESRLAHWTEAQAIPTVELATLKTGGGDQGLVLPGEIRAFNEAQIRARVNGYLKEWKFDIGARVKAGEVLAVIDAPELDQQYEQAKGELAKAEAHAQLAKLTSKRWAALRASTVVSQQSVDEKGGDVNAKVAEVSAARANLDRLKALKGFTEITAPFSGVVTARKVDIGVLVGPGHPIELFDVADIHQMRVYVRVPQSLATRIRQGMKATLTLSQHPGRTFDARVIATSDAIAESSRSLLVQLLAANPDGALLPGSFTEVRFELPKDPSTVRIPATALLFRDNQLHVAIVAPDMKVALKEIHVERDLGTEVEVSSGIGASDRIINYPSDSIRDGDPVLIAEGKSKESAAEQETRGDGK